MFCTNCCDSIVRSGKKESPTSTDALSRKRDGSIKGRMVHNGKPMQEWLNKEESASPTVAMDSLFCALIFDAKERRNVMTVDTPNAFTQTEIDQQDGEDKTVMKIAGVLVDMLAEDSPDTCAECMACKNDKKTLHVEALRATHGMLMSTLLFHMKF